MSDDSMNFAHYVERERDMLTQRRANVNASIEQWRAELASIDREFTAINAYEAAKTGKPQRAARAASTGRRAQYGSRRDAVVKAVREAQDGLGLSRSELLEALGVKGDKRGEMSVSNALTALTKRGELAREGGKYHIHDLDLDAAGLRNAAE